MPRHWQAMAQHIPSPASDKQRNSMTGLGILKDIVPTRPAQKVGAVLRAKGCQGQAGVPEKKE